MTIATIESPTILEAMDTVWRDHFRDRATWAPWRAFLAVLFGLPLDDAGLALFRECTGREAPSPGGFTEAWLLCGRRAGKSRILATIAAYAAVYMDWSQYLVPGESAAIKVVAVDRRQAGVIFRYALSLLKDVPALKPLIGRETDDEINLRNGISIEVQTASFRSIRGYTICALLADELAFWRSDDSANPDGEILTAARAAQATLQGHALLLGASSPYARRGELYRAHQEHYGKSDDPVLVWKAPTRTMNPTISQDFIDKELEKDPVAASAEYLAEFRADVADYIPREIVDAAVQKGIFERPPEAGIKYCGAIDVSGGSVDSYTLAISHAGPDDTVVLDLLREVRPPFSAEQVTIEFMNECRRYGIQHILGDRYGGVWPREAAERSGVTYEVASRAKSDFYQALLPILTSRKASLLDNKRLITQLSGLERRTARGGRDSVDHAAGSHDDLANVAAIALVTAAETNGLYGMPPDSRAFYYFAKREAERAERIMNGEEPEPAYGESTLSPRQRAVRNRARTIAALSPKQRAAWEDSRRRFPAKGSVEYDQMIREQLSAGGPEPSAAHPFKVAAGEHPDSPW